ncbi:flagellar type III secretion system pore protein FliP [Paracoccus thiocyanatus]|uniref:Flagellar biosynthetic protein FliP n=1 Tax=Paracoccus thiocyanatus TaxID=34006 RepID=A0A3D8P8I6_9RHOB|nr:flagellar type III secretion system pore protein FliP [Paracoccus thiocyanatus]RDW12364.1 flagellar biosynthetic protein FliP [Paracoccus thiocyanatus]
MRRLPVLAALVLAAALPQAGLAQDLPLVDAAGLDAVAGGIGRHSITLLAVMTALSLAPGIAIMITCFPFIVTVLSILRVSMGLQQSPPNMLIVSLAMFLTWFVMNPVLTEAWDVAGAPLRDGQITVMQAFESGIVPFRGFMEQRTDPEMMAALAEVAPDPQAPPDRLSVLVPAFMLSEIQRAFEIGFLVALPFLIIDLVVSAVLMSMGMMMVPPVVVALPFKLAFFVVVDGWGMIAAALVRSYQ